MAAATSIESALGSRPSRDPLAAVLALGARSVRVGFLIGLAGALTVHGAAGATAAAQLFDLRNFAKSARRLVIERLAQTIDVTESPAPPKPEPEKEPEEKPPEPTQKAAPNPAAPPPALAEAGKVLTAEADPNEPVDLSGDGFVSGDGDRFAGGTTAATGKSKTAVHDRNARADGVPNGTGSAPNPNPPAQVRDLTRPARPTSSNWNCGFPAEADMAQIDFAVARLVVTVGPDGRAKSVSVVTDPGHGFGALARQCAQRMRYEPGLDATGQATTKTTAPFSVRFTR